jgi:hypothetical protein
MATAQAAAAQKTKENTSPTAIDARKQAKDDETPAAVLIQKETTHPFGEGTQEATRWLTVSPYLEHEHLLDLNRVDTPNRLLALASTELEPANPQYATVKYEDALDWESLMFALKSLAAKEGYRWTRQEFYVVEFRSKLKKDIDVELLFKLDKESHIEATASGGLLKYWYGVPDENRRNLATCGSKQINSY